MSGSNKDVLKVKKEMTAGFDVSGLGEAKFFLGMSIQRHRPSHQLWLGQPRYAANPLERFDMGTCKPRRLPIDVNLSCRRNPGHSMSPW